MAPSDCERRKANQPRGMRVRIPRYASNREAPLRGAKSENRAERPEPWKARLVMMLDKSASKTHLYRTRAIFLDGFALRDARIPAAEYWHRWLRRARCGVCFRAAPGECGWKSRAIPVTVNADGRKAFRVCGGIPFS